MSTGTKPTNNVVIDGTSFQDKYQIAATTAAHLDICRVNSPNGERPFGFWDSATAFSVAAKTACINMPRGSVIIDITAKIMWLKLGVAGTDTWGYSAVLT
jgi:hypothetical protein